MLFGWHKKVAMGLRFTKVCLSLLFGNEEFHEQSELWVTICCELTLTHDTIKEGAPLWQIHSLLSAQPCSENIGS